MVLPDDSGVTGASLGVDNLRDEVCRQALRSNRVLISGIPLKLFVYVSYYETYEAINILIFKGWDIFFILLT